MNGRPNVRAIVGGVTAPSGFRASGLHCGIKASGKPDLTIACALTRRGEDTEVESDFDFRPRGFLKLLFQLLGPVIRRDVPKQFASLKALCEN